MPAVILHPPDPGRRSLSSLSENPLPQLLHTPSGLAIIELQGTINMPSYEADDDDLQSSTQSSDTPIGRLVFPEYSPSDPEGSTAWMKCIHLYVGQHQRLTGEAKKLPKPIALVRRAERVGHSVPDVSGVGSTPQQDGEELEIIEIVRWKILFSQRPEPVGS
ncbi:MAG: hypothetical protein M1825_001627 [Sarcosagium campestre]|nr:MAG: hypothetical protein M1825_001627 [Sarcosagium campestre]